MAISRPFSKQRFEKLRFSFFVSKLIVDDVSLLLMERIVFSNVEPSPIS
jgi:hypothetical protein